MKRLLTLALAAALCATPVFAIGTIITFDSPVDCAQYIAGGGTAVDIDLLSINYETGEVRFRLRDSGGNALGNGAVFGVTLAAPVEEANVKVAVLAAIQAAG